MPSTLTHPTDVSARPTDVSHYVQPTLKAGSPSEHDNLRTYEGLKHALQRPPVAKPGLPPRETYDNVWTAEEKAVYNEARGVWHVNQPLVVTRELREISDAFERRLAISRRQRRGVRQGLIVSGQATLGKTTAAHVFAGRLLPQILAPTRTTTNSDGTQIRSQTIPVVYVSLDGNPTPKSVLRDLAEYLGLSIRVAATENELKAAVTKAMFVCSVEVVMFDDFHFLAATAERQENSVINFIKHLASVVPALFVYFGIGLENTSLLTPENDRQGEIVAQNSGRNALYRLTRNDLGDDEKKTEWRAIIRSFEENLVLFDHQPGSLARDCWGGLYELCVGSIGELRNLFILGAEHAIETGAEALTLPLLESFHRSYFAETNRPVETVQPSQRAIGGRR